MAHWDNQSEMKLDQYREILAKYFANTRDRELIRRTAIIHEVRTWAPGESADLLPEQTEIVIEVPHKRSHGATHYQAWSHRYTKATAKRKGCGYRITLYPLPSDLAEAVAAARGRKGYAATLDNLGDAMHRGELADGRAFEVLSSDRVNPIRG